VVFSIRNSVGANPLVRSIDKAPSPTHTDVA